MRERVASANVRYSVLALLLSFRLQKKRVISESLQRIIQFVGEFMRQAGWPPWLSDSTQMLLCLFQVSKIAAKHDDCFHHALENSGAMRH